MSPVDCAALLQELKDAKALLDSMRKNSAIRSIRDSDGSGVEYSVTAIGTQEQYVNRLAARYDALCGHCSRAASYSFLF